MPDDDTITLTITRKQAAKLEALLALIQQPQEYWDIRRNLKDAAA